MDFHEYLNWRFLPAFERLFRIDFLYQLYVYSVELELQGQQGLEQQHVQVLQNMYQLLQESRLNAWHLIIDVFSLQNKERQQEKFSSRYFTT